jgi:hypothetical protein
MELQLETTLGKAALVLLAAQVAAKPPWQAALCLLVCLRCLWLVIYKVRPWPLTRLGGQQAVVYGVCRNASSPGQATCTTTWGSPRLVQAQQSHPSG